MNQEIQVSNLLRGQASARADFWYGNAKDKTESKNPMNPQYSYWDKTYKINKEMQPAQVMIILAK
jgi:hypothetical protein